ncbi:hypothetical protein Tco_1402537 [Tanacetum coccineum]
MADLTFADSHNMVAYLEKLEANVDFSEIVDILNASPIRHALTTIVITESSMRRDLHFDDEDAVFNAKYDTPTHTKKVFANMRRKAKDFSGTVTPLFPSMLASQAVEGEGSGQPTEPQHTPTTASLSHSSEPTNLDADEAIYEERGDIVERAATTASSLDAEQDSGNINRTQSTIIPNVPFPQGISLGGSPRCQKAMGDTIAQTRSERVSTPSYDSPLLGVNTPRSDEERIKLKELMDMYTKLSDRVLDLENVKDAQALEIKKLKKRSLGQKDASKQGRNSDKTEELNVAEDEHMFDLSDLVGTKVIADQEETTKVEDKDSTADPVTTISETVTTAVDVSVTDDVTLAETLMAIRSSASRPQKLKVVIFKELSKPTTTSRPQPQILAKDKGKGIMQEPEKLVKVKDKDQIKYDADIAQRLQAKIDADAQLAERLQAEEREQMSIKEQARLLMEFIAARKKFFAKEQTKRAEEQRNKPPTKTEQRKKICTDMKHMARYKDKNFKGKSFDAIKLMFDKAYKQVNDFVPMGTKSSGKKKVEDDAEKAELKACLEIVPGDDSAVNIESLAIKYPIVYWKTHILAEDINNYQITRADGSTKYYKIFSVMLDDFDRQDVLDIYRLVKERFETTSLEGYDRLLWGDLITLFEPKKKYPLTQEMLSRMLSGRLEVDHECEMAFKLLRFTRSQLKK